MKKIFISGLLNYETSVNVNKFPIEYSPINYPFFKINSNISGVAYNLLESLITLNNDVSLYTMLALDEIGEMISNNLKSKNIDNIIIDNTISKTPETVVMYDDLGKRSVYCDLKDIQDKKVLNKEVYNKIDESDVLILCNTNFNRELLKYAKSRNKIIATDVHVLSNINDEYNKDFITNANILFLSDEALSEPYKMMDDLINTTNIDIICISRGKNGVIFYDRSKKDIKVFEAYTNVKVVNTLGAGDALFSSFINFYTKEQDSYKAIKKAIIYAGLKVETSGGSKGFQTEAKINDLYINLNK